MGLPTVEQLDALGQIELDEDKVIQTSFRQLYGLLKTIVITASPSAAQSAVTHGANAAGVSSGLMLGGVVTVAPIGAALAPWIGAAMVGSQAGKVMALYDIRDGVNGRSIGDYRCDCNHCKEHIQYIIDKKEFGVAYIAVGVATLGVFTMGKAAHSLGKKLYSAAKGEQRPKERVCKALVSAAREKKCKAAMATIFLLSGSWSLNGSADKNTWCTAAAIIGSGDGWSELKTKW